MAADTDTLRRTPLHDRHVAAGARLVPFAGWEMPVQYPAGIRAEHAAVREHAGVFDVCHMGEIETRGPGAEALLQRLVTNDVAQAADGGAQYALLCSDDGGVLDDLFTYRLAPDRFLTVTNAANHARDLAWFQAHATDAGVQVIDRIERPRDARRPGARRARARRCAHRRRAPRPLPHRRADRGRRVRRPRLRHGLHGRGRRRAARRPRATRPRCGTRSSPAAPSPSAWARATRCALEACFHLYGNDLSEDRGPIEAGLGWACKEATGFIGPRRVARDRADGTAERLVALRDHRPGYRAPGQPGARRRRRHVSGRCRRRSATASAWPTFRRSAPRRAPRSRSTSAAARATPRSARSH